MPILIHFEFEDLKKAENQEFLKAVGACFNEYRTNYILLPYRKTESELMDRFKNYVNEKFTSIKKQNFLTKLLYSFIYHKPNNPTNNRQTQGNFPEIPSVLNPAIETLNDRKSIARGKWAIYFISSFGEYTQSEIKLINSIYEFTKGRFKLAFDEDHRAMIKDNKIKIPANVLLIDGDILNKEIKINEVF